MALAIREIPVLTGQTAIDFMNEADKYAGRPVPRLTEAQEAILPDEPLETRMMYFDLKKL